MVKIRLILASVATDLPPASETSSARRALDGVALLGHDHLGPHTEQAHLALGVEPADECDRGLDDLLALRRRRSQLLGLGLREEGRVAHLEGHSEDRATVSHGVVEGLRRELTDG